MKSTDETPAQPLFKPAFYCQVAPQQQRMFPDPPAAQQYSPHEAALTIKIKVPDRKRSPLPLRLKDADPAENCYFAYKNVDRGTAFPSSCMDNRETEEGRGEREAAATGHGELSNLAQSQQFTDVSPPIHCCLD